MLQPPTDNLYKFLAIAGLVSMIASVYLLMEKESECFARRLKLESELDLLLQEFHAKHGSEICHEELGYPKKREKTPHSDSLPFGVANADRNETLRHLDLHWAQLGKLMTHPRYSKESFLFWKSWFALNDQELTLWMEDPSKDSQIEQIRSSAIEFRPRYARSMQIAREIWKNEDSLQDHALICQIGLGGGLIFMLGGFALWLLLVQLPQDQLLHAEVRSKIPQ